MSGMRETMRKTPREVKQAVDAVVHAGDVARQLGHVPLRDGSNYACWHCDLTGHVVDGSRVGDLFTKECKR